MIEQGTSGLIQQPNARSFTAGQGDRIVQRWMGNFADAETAYLGYAASGLSTTLEPLEGGKAMVSLILGDLDDEPPVTWSLDTKLEAVAALEAPLVKARIQYRDAITDRALYYQFCRDLNRASLGFFPKYTYPGEDEPLANALAEVALRKESSYYRVEAVLRKTRIVAANTAHVADWRNVMKYITTANLIACESITATIVGTLPPGDWLKTPAGVLPRGDGLYTITTEWMYHESGHWSSYFYGSYVNNLP